MSLLDDLRDEMKKRGCTDSQINSKAVAVVLDIVSSSGNKYTAIQEEEKECSRLIREFRFEKRELEHKKAELKDMAYTINCREEYVTKYIESFNNSLAECETEEGRDAMRRAQVFVNSVSIDTKYDNTAFIASLGAILSDGKIGALEEYKRINPKINPPTKWKKSLGSI